MKTILVIISVMFLSAAIACASVIYAFEYRTGFSLLEMLDIKTNCETKYTEHCYLIYSFMPYTGRPKMVIPESEIL